MRSLSLIGLFAPAFVFANSEGVSPKATDLFTIAGYPISNSILTTWIIAALIIIAVRLAVGTPKLIPGKGQAVVEGMAQGLRDALEPIVGKQMISKTFPLLCGFFVFILLMNWSGLLPGVGTLKFQETLKDKVVYVSKEVSLSKDLEAAINEQHGTITREPKGEAFYAVLGVKPAEELKTINAVRIIDLPHLDRISKHASWEDSIRPANSDLNTTFALSIISFLAWTYFVLRYAGVKVLIFDLFGNKSDRKEIGWVMWILLSFIFVGVGGIEVVSIAFRLISLSFRLYGNVFGGENLIHSLGGIAPYVIPAAAGMLEVLVGVIQAFVFTLLSAVYIGLICNHEGGHDEEEHAH